MDQSLRGLPAPFKYSWWWCWVSGGLGGVGVVVRGGPGVGQYWGSWVIRGRGARLHRVREKQINT